MFETDYKPLYTKYKNMYYKKINGSYEEKNDEDAYNFLII